jgi:hypothetical protein
MGLREMSVLGAMVEDAVDIMSPESGRAVVLRPLDDSLTTGHLHAMSPDQSRIEELQRQKVEVRFHLDRCSEHYAQHYLLLATRLTSAHRDPLGRASVVTVSEISAMRER